MEAVIKLKENIFQHFRGKVEICEECYILEKETH